MGTITFVIMLVICGFAVWAGRPAKWQEPYFETGRYVEERFEWARKLVGVLPEGMTKHLDKAYGHLERSKVLWREGYREDALRAAMCAKDEVTKAEALYGENPIVSDEKAWFKSEKKN